MLTRLKLIFKLFRKPLLFSSLLYLAVLILFTSLIGLKESYKISLQTAFASKQPHIKVSYIKDMVIMSSHDIQIQKERIRSLSPFINEVSEFVSGNNFYSSHGFKQGGSATYQGDILIIGLSTKDFAYDFMNAEFTSRPPYTIAYTPLEFLYHFKTDDKAVMFNTSLFNSYFPSIASMQDFSLIDDKTKHEIHLLGRFKDYDKQAIIYTNVKMANQLLSKHNNNIDGFFINAKKLEEIEPLYEHLKTTLDPKTFIVSSWLELRQKQFLMFKIFGGLSTLVLGLIISLTLLFIFLILYNAIIQKSYHLSVLLTIGYKLNKEIFILFSLLILIDTGLALIYIDYILPLLSSHFSLPYASYIQLNTSLYLSAFTFIFGLLTYILIQVAYTIRSKSVF